MSSKKKTSSTKSESTSALVPKLRFPEYWGDSAWTEKPLKEAAQINPVNSQLPESFVYIDLESVVAGELKAKKRISRIGAPSRAQRIVQKGDIIYQVVRPYQRNNLLCEFEHDENYVASTGYAQLRARGNNMFLYQAIQTDSFVGRVIAKCSGSSYPAINASELAEIRLPIPPTLEEQQHVALCLSSLDNLISSQARKVELLKKHKKGLLQQLFPREGETEPRLRFSEFRGTGAWEKRTLGDLGEIITGKTPSTKESELWGGDILFITPTDISKDEKYQHNTARTVVGTKRTKVLPNGSVVYTCVASIGKMAITVRPSITNQQINAVAPNKEVLGEFIYYALTFLTPWIKTIPASNTLPIINKTDFSQIAIAQPVEKSEQQRIATCLSSLDDLISSQTQKLEALKIHKKGLMQGLFASIPNS